MRDQHKTKSQLIYEINELREKIVKPEKQINYSSHLQKQEEIHIVNNETLDKGTKYLTSYQLLANIMDHTPMMAVYLDVNFNFVWVNKAYADTCLHDPSFFPGKNHFDLYPDAENQAIFQSVVDTGEPFFVEAKPFVFPDQPDRGVTYWDWSLIPVKDDSGKVNGLVFTLAEVTKRIKTETALKESEERFRMLFMSMSEGFYLSEVIYDDNGNPCDYRFLEVNPKFEQIAGLKRDQIIGKRYKEIVPVDSTQWLDTYCEIARSGISKNYYFYSPEYDRYFETFAYRMEKNQVTVFVIDVTKQKQAEEERAKLEAQLHRSQKLETIGTLAGGIAHDFNNILTPILGYAELALSSLPISDPLADDIQHIVMGANRAKELIQQILLFSRKIEIERRPLKLQLVLKEAIKLLRPAVPSTIKIREQIDTSCKTILADQSQMHQVIVNLCTNAYQAMEEKGGILSIDLKEVQVDAEAEQFHLNLNQKDYILLTVSDTGIGMDKNTLSRIFEPFFTTKTVSKGNGLGLSVVHGIVRSHKGDILVESEPGKGTKMQIYFPVFDSKMQNGPEDDDIIHEGFESILIVDDEEQVGNMLKRILERLGYRAIYINNSLEAVKIFSKNPENYNLLITDLTMPHTTGLVLAEKFKKIRAEFPIIIMTGYGDSITPSTLKQYGVQELIEKPFAINKISTVVKKMLKQE